MKKLIYVIAILMVTYSVTFAVEDRTAIYTKSIDNWASLERQDTNINILFKFKNGDYAYYSFSSHQILFRIRDKPSLFISFWDNHKKYEGSTSPVVVKSKIDSITIYLTKEDFDLLHTRGKVDHYSTGWSNKPIVYKKPIVVKSKDIGKAKTKESKFNNDIWDMKL